MISVREPNAVRQARRYDAMLVQMLVHHTAAFYAAFIAAGIREPEVQELGRFKWFAVDGRAVLVRISPTGALAWVYLATVNNGGVGHVARLPVTMLDAIRSVS